MDVATFASERNERLTVAEESLTEFVDDALNRYIAGDPEWSEDLVAAASRIWYENFQAEAPGARGVAARRRFEANVSDALDKTSDPGMEVAKSQVDRITRWLATYSVNSGTVAGAFQKGVRFKLWVTMRDTAVRDIHAPLDGQVKPIGGTFDVAGTKLGYPGEPVGPPEVWINCRCVAMPASREGEAMSANTYVLGPEDATEDNPDVVEGYDAFALPSEMPTEDEPPQPTADDGPAIVEATTENGTTYFGPFDTAENAAAWIESGSAPYDGEFMVIPLTEVPDREAVVAAAVDPSDIAVEPPDEEDLVPDEPDEDEDFITEIPVHGVSIIEGRATGDGRGFRNNALTFDDVPQPLGYEFEHGHGSDNSRVAIVGRIDEIFRKPIDDETSEVRWRGVIILTKEYAAQAVESIVDGSYNGSSVIVDDVTIDVEDVKTQMRAQMEADDDGDEGDIVDLFVGDGTQQVTWIASGRQRRLDMVPTGAFIESRIGLGHAFDDELSDADMQALAACGCMGSELATETDEFREFPPEQREKDASSGAAMPDGSYPIENCDDLRNAIQAIGRAKDPDATKAHIRKRKSALGCPEVELPEDWSAIYEPDGDGHRFGGPSVYEDISFAPGTHDGPGWITHPIPTARIRRYWVKGEGAAKIKWGVPGDFNRCRRQLAKYVQNPEWLAGLCANMHYEALGTWPGRERGDKHSLSAPLVTLTASASVVYDAALFAEPELDHAAPVRIDRDTRRIYGYLAEWGTCHVGVQGMCQEVPQSYNDYAYFLKGRVQTTAGFQRVGTLTEGIGHANSRLRAAAATAHYDRTDAVRGYVNMGQNALGIWYSGVVPPEVTDAQMDRIEAIGAFSGDWRDWGQGGLDLIGAVCVNTPGFQLVADGGVQSAMMGTNLQKEVLVASASVRLDADVVAAIARTAVDEYRHQEKVAARAERTAPARTHVRTARLAAARARIEKG